MNCKINFTHKLKYHFLKLIQTIHLFETLENYLLWKWSNLYNLEKVSFTKNLIRIFGYIMKVKD